MSALFADMVQQRIAGSAALAFRVRSWMLPDLTSGCLQERRVSGVWPAPHFLLSTSAPRQDQLLLLLLLCWMATNKIC